MARSPSVVLSMMRLDHYPGPRYRQLFCAIRDAILDGRLGPGAKLPPSRELASQLDMARNTVIEAYELLVAEGYILSKVGAGSFVSNEFAERFDTTPRQSANKRQGGDLSARGEWHRNFDSSPTSPGVKIFTPGIPDLDQFPVDAWRRLLSRSWRQTGRDLLQPGDHAGSASLRKAIAAHVGPARGVQCKPEQVMLVTSSRQAIYLAGMVLGDRGDRAWIEDPAYFDARASLLAAGLSLVPVPVDEQGLQVDIGVKRAADARLAFVTPSNHYPLGVTMTLARRLRLLEWANQANAWIVEDDYDGEFRYVGKPLTALQGLDGNERVIYVGSFSKTMFPSLRIAFLVCPENLIDAFIAARRPVDGPLSTNSQGALTEFIEAGFYASHVKQMRDLYAERQSALVELLRRGFGDSIRLEGQQAGIHLLATLPDGVRDRALIDEIADADVGPVPLSRYLLEPTGKSGLVLGYGNSRIDQLQRGVKALRKAFDRVASTKTKGRAA